MRRLPRPQATVRLLELPRRAAGETNGEAFPKNFRISSFLAPEETYGVNVRLNLPATALLVISRRKRSNLALREFRLNDAAQLISGHMTGPGEDYFPRFPDYI